MLIFFKRFCLGVAAITLLALAVIYFCANQIAGEAVSQVFSRGTGCVVKLEKPAVSFFPLQASAYNVAIYNKNEGSLGGFRAEHLLVRLSFSSLFEKVVRFEEFRITGADVSSLSSDSGFVSTIEFLFPPDSEKNHSKQWHDFLTQGWRVWVPELVIESMDDDQNHFRFGDEDMSIYAQHVKFTSRDLTGEVGSTVSMQVESRGVGLWTTLFGKRKIGKLSALADIANGRLDLKEFDLFSTEAELVSSGDQVKSSELNASGHILLREPTAYNISFAGELDSLFLQNFINMSDSQLFPDDGKFAVSGELGGELSDPEVSSEIRLSSAQTRKLVDLAYQRDMLQFKFSEQSQGERSSSIDADCSYDILKKKAVCKSYRLKSYAALKLASTLEPFISKELADKVFPLLTAESVIDGKGNFNFDLAAQTINGGSEIQVSQINLAEIPVSNLDIALNLSGRRIRVEKASALTQYGSVQASLDYLIGDKLVLSAQTSGLDLAGVEGLDDIFPESSLKLSGRFQAEGRLSAINYTGSFQLAGIDGKDLPASEKPFYLTFEGAGSLDGRGSIVVADFQLKRPGLNLSNDSPLRIDFAENKLTFTDVNLSVNNEKFNLAGYLDADTGWDASLAARVPFKITRSELSSVELVSGELIVDLKLEGELRSPLMAGSVLLRGGEVSLPIGNTVVGAEDISIDAGLRGEMIEINALSASIGDGSISGRGRIEQVFSPEQRRGRLDLDFRDLFLEPIPNLTFLLNSDLLLSLGIGESMTLSGDVLVEKGRYEDNIELARVLKVVGDYITGGAGKFDLEQKRSGSRGLGGRDLKLSIKLKTEDDFRVDTNIGQLELSADLLLCGSALDPRLDGEIEALNGTFGLGSSTFSIIHGSALYKKSNEKLNPELNIVGESVVKTATGGEQAVQLGVSGTLLDPKVEFSSDGGLDQREIASLLGQSGGSVGGLTLVGSTGKERTFRELISPASDVSIHDRLAGLTGFSEVGLATELSDKTGEFVPSIHATRPLSKKVDMNIESELSSERVSRFSIDYSITPYLSLLTAWDNTSAVSNVDTGSGSFSVGLRYRRTFPGLRMWGLRGVQ